MASPDRVHAGGPSCAYEDTFDSGSERKSEDAEAQAMLGGPQRSTTIQHSNHERFRAGARSVLSWLLWALIAVVVVFAVIMTLPRESSQPRPGDDIYGALPQLSSERVTFRDQVAEFTPNYTSEPNSLEVLDRWRTLIPKGSGNIDLGDLDQYDESIPSPYKISGFGDLYMVSWVHQLQCLYYVMNAYDVLIRLGPTGSESLPQHSKNYPHTRECYDYLRQVIMCHADMTLEGASGNGPPRGTDGFGFTHVCRSNSDAKTWTEAHRPFDDQDVFGS